MTQKSKAGVTVLVIHKKSCMRPEVKAAVKAVQSAGHKLRVIIPWNGKELKRALAREIAGGATRIIAGGGDGTLNKVTRRLMKHGWNEKVSLGVMPLGTANDFARGAGLPLDDLEAALTRACSGEATPIDIGQMNGTYFINVASGGFGSEVTAATPQNIKKVLGGAAYTLMGIAMAKDLKPYRCTFEAADGEKLDVSLLVMAVGNNRYAGGAFDVAPKADLTDGLLDVALLTEFTPSDIAAVSAELQNPFDENNRFLIYRQVSDFTIKSDRPFHVNLDGEPVKSEHFSFTVKPASLSVVLGH